MKRLCLILLVLLAPAGCARDDGEADLPASCKADASSFVRALETAPSPVSVDGVSISDCLARESSAGDVQLVGSVLLQAAQRLGEGKRALPLGYLVGAVRRGSERGQGIYAELRRRIEQEAAPFRHSPAFGAGLRAGRTSG